MSENNEAKPTYEELEAKLSSVTAERNSYEQRMQVAENTLNRAKIWFQEMLEGDIDAGTTVSEFEGLMDILEIDTTREAKIEVEVTWRGTIQLPYGTDVGDLDIDDFDIEVNGHNEYDTNFTYDGIYDSEIRERRYF